MKAGGGKAKGAEWERQVGKELSLWLTNQRRPDIFARNVLSGGAFTVATSKGQQSSRMAGDLMAAHPSAFKFLARFMVECKHLQSLGLENYLFDLTGTSALGQIVMYAAGQAAQASLDWMIIAKQNRRQPIVLVEGHIGERLLAASVKTGRIRALPPHHLLHRRRIFVMRLGDLVSMVDPDQLLG